MDWSTGNVLYLLRFMTCFYDHDWMVDGFVCPLLAGVHLDYYLVSFCEIFSSMCILHTPPYIVNASPFLRPSAES